MPPESGCGVQALYSYVCLLHRFLARFEHWMVWSGKNKPILRLRSREGGKRSNSNHIQHEPSAPPQVRGPTVLITSPETVRGLEPVGARSVRARCDLCLDRLPPSRLVLIPGGQNSLCHGLSEQTRLGCGSAESTTLGLLMSALFIKPKSLAMNLEQSFCCFPILTFPAHSLAEDTRV